jgi:hypothetical protein
MALPTAPSTFTPPALELPEALRLKVAKAAQRHGGGTPIKIRVLDRLKGAVRANGTKNDVAKQLAKLSGEEEWVLRALLKIWFEERQSLGNYMRPVLAAAGYAVHEPDFSQPLRPGRLGTSPEPPGLCRSGEELDQCRLMAWLLGWPVAEPSAGSHAGAQYKAEPVAAAPPPAVRPVTTASEDLGWQEDTEPGKPTALVSLDTLNVRQLPTMSLYSATAGQEILDQLAARIDDVLARMHVAASEAELQAAALRAGKPPVATEADLPQLASDFQAIAQALVQQAQIHALPWPSEADSLPALREVLQLVQAAVVAEAARSTLAQAQLILARVATIRHRRKVVFAPLAAIKKQAEAVAHQLAEDTPLAATLCAELLSGTHALAHFVELVTTYEVLQQADDSESALAEAGEVLRALPGGMELYTAWVLGLLEEGPASEPAAINQLILSSEAPKPSSSEAPAAPEGTGTSTAFEEPVPDIDIPVRLPLATDADASAPATVHQEDTPPTAAEIQHGQSATELSTRATRSVEAEELSSSSSEVPATSLLPGEKTAEGGPSIAAGHAPAVLAVAQPGMAAAFWQLLEEGRDAWVYQLARGQAALATSADYPLLPAWLLRVGILGPQIRSAYGVLAELLTYDALAASDQVWVEGDGEAPGTRALLAWAGALRPALLAPDTGLGEWLVLATLHEFPYLTAIGQYILARNSPVPFGGEQLSQAQAQERWQQQARRLADDLDAWEVEQRKPALFRRQRNHPITRFWQALLAPERRVAQVLEVLGRHEQPLAHDEADLSGALAVLENWSSLGAELRRLGFTHDDIVTIEGNRYARVWLSDRVAELAELVRRYRELVQRRPAPTHVAREQDDHRLLQQLHEKLPAAAAALAQQQAAESNASRRVALSRCQVAIANLLDWLAQPAARVDTSETSPRHWLGLPWLLLEAAPPLNQQWEPEQDTPETQAQLLAAARQPPPTWAAWYAQQVASPEPDHQLTARLLAVMETLPPVAAAQLGALPAPLEQLRHERSLQVAEQQRRLHQVVQQTRRELERARRYGYANPDDEWYVRAQSTLSQLQALSGTRSDEEEDDLYNFRAHHAQLAQLREVLANLRQQEATRRRAAIAEALAAANEKPGRDDQRLLDQALAEGWFSLTDDYLSHLQRGHRLRQFAPTPAPVLLTLEAELQHITQATEALEPYQVLEQLRTGTLLGQEEEAGSKLADQRHQAAQSFESWCELRALTELNAEDHALLRRTLEQVLSFIGFRVEQVERLGTLAGGGRRSRYLDLKTQPLRGREHCPVGRYGSDADGEYRLLCLWQMPTARELFDLVRNNSNPEAGRPVIVVVLTPIPWDQREALGVYCRQQYGDFLVLDELLLLHLATYGLQVISQDARSNKSLLRLFFQLALPFSYLNPFVTSGAVPPEMFFGRENDFRRLASRSKDSARILYGGRQLGKTVLLRRVADQTHDPAAGNYVLFVDVQPLRHSTVDKIQVDVSTLLLRYLREAGVEVVQEKKDVPALSTILDELAKWASVQAKRSLTLLLDEADYLLELDSVNNFKIVSEFRSVMEQTEQRIKIVLSGLHNVQHIYRLPNQPLIQLGQPIEIGPLAPREGTALIQEPLESLGFYFGTVTATGFEPAEHLIDQIGVETNYYPSLIQEFCSKLLEVLYKRQREDSDNYLHYCITEEDVQKASERAQPEIRHRFRLTLDLNPRFRLLAYLVAELTAQTTGARPHTPAEPTVGQVLEMARVYYERGFERPQHQHDYVEQLLEELVGLHILDRIRIRNDYDQTRYRLRTANVRTLLGTKADIQHELEKFSTEPPPLEYAVGIARDKYLPADTPVVRGKTTRLLRSPLTVSDLQQLELPGVSIVYGTAAAGLDLLEEFFEGRATTFKFKLHKVACQPDERQLKVRLDELRQQRKTRTQHLVLVQDCYSGQHVQQALAELERWPDTAARLQVVFMMGAATLWRFLADDLSLDQLQSQGAVLLPLVPWHPLTVKEWLDAESLASRQWEQVYAATGGWQVLLHQFFQLEQPAPGTPAPASRPVQDVEQHLLRVQDSVAQGAYTAAWGLAEAPDFFRRLAEEWPDKPFHLEHVELANLDAARPCPPADLPRWLRWAELLALVLPKSEGRYQFTPLVAQALLAHG